jgi:hypothetical protein
MDDLIDNVVKICHYSEKCKGSGCSESGNNYEKDIWNIVKECVYNTKPFNTQDIHELGGSSSKNDIECNSIKPKDIGIEVKKCNTPDWMQCSLKYNKEEGRWVASSRGKIPKEAGEIFNKLLQNIKLYNGEIPPFMINDITHEEWKKIKKETDKWNDKYIDIPSDTINKLYNSKGCQYIQVSDKGLYYLNNDPCNFNVPQFNIPQQIRIRTKIHTKKNKKGFCKLSITAACQPKNIKIYPKSKYSLDDINKLPLNLIYKI